VEEVPVQGGLGDSRLPGHRGRHPGFTPSLGPQPRNYLSAAARSRGCYGRWLGLAGRRHHGRYSGPDLGTWPRFRGISYGSGGNTRSVGYNNLNDLMRAAVASRAASGQIAPRSERGRLALPAGVSFLPRRGLYHTPPRVYRLPLEGFLPRGKLRADMSADLRRYGADCRSLNTTTGSLWSAHEGVYRFS
jgi:hypothetical protein